jgi:ORF6N domain-containing protein
MSDTYPMPSSRAVLMPVESRILILRHQKVMLDVDLAELYGVSVKRLNEQVKRNQQRFPTDFMFRLTKREQESLRSQIVISKKAHGGRRYLPYAFTEHGAIMAATVLNSKLAIQMSVFVVRAFVRLREMLASNRKLAGKIAELESHVDTHDDAIHEIIRTIKELTVTRRSARTGIGFRYPAIRGAGIAPTLTASRRAHSLR